MDKKEHIKLVNAIMGELNNLPFEERKRIGIYTRSEKIRTIIQVKSLYDRYLSPCAKAKLTKWENDLCDSLSSELKEQRNQTSQEREPQAEIHSAVIEEAINPIQNACEVLEILKKHPHTKLSTIIEFSKNSKKYGWVLNNERLWAFDIDLSIREYLTIEKWLEEN